MYIFNSVQMTNVYTITQLFLPAHSFVLSTRVFKFPEISRIFLNLPEIFQKKLKISCIHIQKM